MDASFEFGQWKRCLHAGLLLISAALLPAMAPQDEAGQRYREGKQALNAREWSTAADHFRFVFGGDGDRASGAGYWLAYALNKASDPDGALAVIGELKTRYPRSSWLEDAAALEAEIRHAAGQSTAPAIDGDASLRKAAMTTLLYMDAEEALPIIDKILVGNFSQEEKKRALFVLGEKGGEQALSRLKDVALNNTDKALRSSAIQFLGMFDHQGALTFLNELYEERPEHRKRIISAAFTGGHVDWLIDRRSREQDPSLRASILTYLAQTEAAKDFGNYYKDAATTKEKQAIITGMFIGRQEDPLFEVATTETNEKLRADAINKLGLIQACDRLDQIYNNSEFYADKQAVISAMFLAEKCSRLPELARSESDDRLQIEAIQRLGLLNGKYADVLVEIYDQSPALRTRRAVLSALFVGQQDEALIAIIEKEDNPTLKQQAVQNLGMIGSDKAKEYLKTLLDL